MGLIYHTKRKENVSNFLRCQSIYPNCLQLIMTKTSLSLTVKKKDMSMIIIIVLKYIQQMQALALTQEMSPILLLLDVLLIQAFCDSHVFPNFIIYLFKIMGSRAIIINTVEISIL